MSILGKHVITLSAILFFGGCDSRESMPMGEPNGFAKVEIYEKEGEKTLYFNRKFYVGAIGAHGWVGWVTYSYNVTLPLGKVRNVMNPPIFGPDTVGGTFGYMTFDEKKQEITIRMRQVHYRNFDFDPAYGGKMNSLEIVDEFEMPLNGTYHVDDLAAFK